MFRDAGNSIWTSLTGKSALINLMQLNKEISQILIQLGILDRSTKFLSRYMSDAISSSSSIIEQQSPSQFIICIQEILYEILTSQNIVFPKIQPLIDILERIKNDESLKEIQMKIKSIQYLINEEGIEQDDNTAHVQLDKKMIQLQEKINKYEVEIIKKDESLQMHENEKLNYQSEKQQLVQQISTLENEKYQNNQSRDYFNQRIQALEQKNLQNLQIINQLTLDKENNNKLANRYKQIIQEQNQSITNLEQQKLDSNNTVQNLQQQIQYRDDSINELSKLKNNNELLISQLQQQIYEKNQSNGNLIREKSLVEQKLTEQEKQNKTQQQKITDLEGQNKQLNIEKQQTGDKIRQLDLDKHQKELRIDVLEKGKIQNEQKIKNQEQQINSLQQEKQKEKTRALTAEQKQTRSEIQATEIQNQFDELLKDMVQETDKQKVYLMPWIQMRKDLEEIKPFWQSQADKEMKLQRQIHVCQLVIDMFENNDKDIEGRRRCINAGIPTALAQLYEKQDDIFIKQQHIDAFFYIGVYEVNIIGQLLFSKYLFGGLLRILQHPDNSITFRGIQCIFNIIVAGSNINLSPQVLHPYFDSIGGHSGIKRLYEFFNKWNQYECSKNTASICIGNLCRARMIEDETIRKNIIAHLKKIINDTDKWTRDSSRFALQYLASNSVNKAEITKDGFAVPK